MCLAEHVDTALPVVLKGSGHPFRGFELDSKMTAAVLIAMSADAEVEPPILDFPSGVIRLPMRRLGAKKVGVEFNHSIIIEIYQQNNAPGVEWA